MKRTTKTARKATKATTKSTKTMKQSKSVKTRKVTKTATPKAVVTKTKASAQDTLIEYKFADSTAVRSVRWLASRSNANMGNMTVTFSDGNMYLYRNVERQMVRGWMRVKSAGRYFQTHFKEMRSERV